MTSEFTISKLCFEVLVCGPLLYRMRPGCVRTPSMWAWTQKP